MGLVFTISNRIGATMWAHGQFFLTIRGIHHSRTCTRLRADMEKRQHFIADEKHKGNQHPTLALPSLFEKSSTPSFTYTAPESRQAHDLSHWTGHFYLFSS